MNPPLPPPPGELLNLGTITLMICITFLMQAIAIAVNSVTVQEYRGVRTMFLATLAMSLGFFLILFHPMVGFAIGIASNIAIYTGNTLLYFSICQFTERPAHRWVAYGLVPLGYLALLLVGFTRFPMIIITELANIPLSIASAYVLLKADHKAYRLGAYAAAIPLMLYALVSLARMASAIVSPAEITPGPSNTNVLSILLVFILSYFWTAGFILMISQRLQSDLRDLAMNDMLTRVRNRRAMHGLLDYELKRTQNEVKDFSIILLDVDHFKRVNDTYGHDVGDEVLKWMAQNLQASSRLQDTVSRWGGEEFLILLPSTTLEEAIEVAERTRSHVESSSFTNGNEPIKITFSAGVAWSQNHRDVDKLCKVADQALYLAKKTRNRVVAQTQIESEA